MDNKLSTRNNARRLILRNLVLGGSATAATKLLPENWIKPVVNSVIAPSHATMSEVTPEEMPAMPVGIFETEGDVVLNLDSGSSLEYFANHAQANESVLDFFIKPVNAGMTEIIVEPPEEEMCDFVIKGGLTFNIPANPGPVDICAFGGISLMSTIDGTTIEDFGGVKDFMFTDIVATDEEISGNFEYPIHSGENVVTNCSTPFSAPLVEGVYSCED